MSSREQTKLINYYLTLDILPGASHNEILHAYNRSKMTYASGSLASYGLFEGDTSRSILDEIEDAFSILGNPAKRREYDLKMGFRTWVDEDARPSSVRPEAVNTEHPMLTTLQKDELAPRRLSSVPVSVPEEPVRVTRTASASSTPDFEPNPDFEQRIHDCKEIDGAFLKAVRIYRRLALDQVATLCKLSASHVEVVENEDTSHRPQSVYLRGHVYLMAQALGLPDPGALAQTYIAKLRSENKLPRGRFV